jgi:catechol 2,3-dioxygenase-like lactoylglutathione lyase family enzyme
MAMASYQCAVPVLQVANVETSCRWYADVLGFAANPFPKSPPYTFAILRRDGAEIMLQRADDATDDAGAPQRRADPEFRWSIYLRISGTEILDVAAAAGRKAKLMRGPERMVYGLVEFELCDPDGYRVCVSGETPAGTTVKAREE